MTETTQHNLENHKSIISYNNCLLLYEPGCKISVYTAFASSDSSEEHTICKFLSEHSLLALICI